MKTILLVAALIVVSLPTHAYPQANKTLAAKQLHECTINEPELEDWPNWKCILPLQRYDVCVTKWRNALQHGNETLDGFCGPVPRAARKLYEESKDLPPLDDEYAWELIRKQAEPR